MSHKVVLCFGRFNPVHLGTEKLFNFARDLAKEEHADFRIYTTHTQDQKRNPLNYKNKIKYLRLSFPEYKGNVIVSEKNTIFEILRELQIHYRIVTLVVGEDRVEQFRKAIEPYVNTEHPDALTLNGFEVVSAGDRDPDSKNYKEAISSTKMRDYAIENDFDSFYKGLPKALSKPQAQQLFQLVKKGMGAKEHINSSLKESMAKKESDDRDYHEKSYDRFREFFVKNMDEEEGTAAYPYVKSFSDHDQLDNYIERIQKSDNLAHGHKLTYDGSKYWGIFYKGVKPDKSKSLQLLKKAGYSSSYNADIENY